MKSWICPCNAKNDYDAETCYLCGAPTNVVVKEKKPIKKVSETRKADLDLYSVMREKFLEDKKRCECCGEGNGEQKTKGLAYSSPHERS